MEPNTNNINHKNSIIYSEDNELANVGRFKAKIELLRKSECKFSKALEF